MIFKKRLWQPPQSDLGIHQALALFSISFVELKCLIFDSSLLYFLRYIEMRLLIRG